MEFRQLPDGTWLNETTDTVSAPLNQSPRPSATAGQTAPSSWKKSPTPGSGPQGPLLLPDAPAAMTHDLNGMGEGFSGARRAITIGAIVGVCALTVWLQNRGKKKAKKG